MNRGPQRPLNEELQALEQELATLTLRVAAIRKRVKPQPTNHLRPPIVGDRVRFTLAGHNNAEGVVISVTPRRVRIRQDQTNDILLRAPHNVTIL
jgi:hypothetical protein